MIHQRTLQALEFPKVISLLEGYCLSAQGRLLATALSPLLHVEEAEEALSLYEDSCTWALDPNARKQYTDVSFPDVSPLIRACTKSHFSPDADSFWALRQVLNLARSARSSIVQEHGEEKWPTLYTRAAGHELPLKLVSALNRCISDDALLKDESSPELYRLRGEIRSLHQNCLRRVHEFAVKFNILNYLQEEFMTISQDRYVLPLKATYKGRLQGILHDWSQTGETCYFEPMFLVELNNRLQELRREEREEEFRILDYLATLLRDDLPNVKKALDLLTLLDLLHAKRSLGELLDAHSITFTEEDAGIELLGARHPLLYAAQNQKQDGKTRSCHPLDIVFRSNDHCLLITGGNAGGKTVCLKTLGLIFAMAASGLPVPCAKGSHLFWCERLDAFIGDEQDLADNVSTFTAQIEHLSKAWKHLHKKSLVLLDEFGAGTDPTHGAALAQAVLDELIERGSFVLAATHFPTLKIWALSTKGVRAASMLFDPQSKKPLYTLAYDQVGASQTLLVAKDHGLPPEIISRAEKYLLLSSDDVSSQLERLNNLAVERERELTELKHLQDKTKNDAKNREAKLERERLRLEEEVGKKIHELMQGWKQEKSTARQSLVEMKRLRQELAKSKPEEKEKHSPEVGKLEIGSRVKHRSLQKFGIITDKDERRGKVRLDLGGITLWANVHDISEMASQEPKVQDKSVLVHGGSGGFAMTLDVRGYTVENALSEVERFLDKMLVSGLSSVDIIHGRGTGVLRRELHTYLKNYPNIDHFELAPEDQGGDGKTIVYFR